MFESASCTATVSTATVRVYPIRHRRCVPWSCPARRRDKRDTQNVMWTYKFEYEEATCNYYP